MGEYRERAGRDSARRGPRRRRERARQPAPVSGLNRDSRRSAVVHCRDLHTNRIERIDADYILVADGKPALGSRPGFDVRSRHQDAFQGITGLGDAIELFGVAGHYGGLAPSKATLEHRVQHSRWRVNHVGGISIRCSSCSSRRIDRCKNACAARSVSPWLASPLPRFAVTNHWPSHVIPIGNAAASIEPIGGEGMGLAMASAEIARAC